MKLETFFDNFEVLAEAPNGVKKLRELILELAVRGKLMAQDESDEPAEVLLKKIKVEKEKLTNKREIEKTESLSFAKTEKMIYDLLKAWKWSKFSEICSYIQRGKSPDYVEKSNFPVISQKCVQWKGLKIENVRFITPSSIEKYDKERFLRTGDILWNSTGTGTVGRVCIYVHESDFYEKVVVDSHVTIVRPIKVNPKFLYLWIASPSVQNEIENLTSGSTKQVELATSTIRSQGVPIPPLEEQRRIVAKVDQLMSLCDELEARQQKKRESRAHLNSAALDKMLSARALEEFAAAWQRVSENFDLLYDAPENVGALRKAILQLAVMGKLVEQDEKEEPAAVLLRQINKEKERIVNEGKIKLIKTSSIENDKLTFELPKNWEWTRLGNITIKLGAGSTPLGGKSVYEKTGIKFIRSQNVWNDGLRLEDIACISTDIHQQMSGTNVKPGDILLNITGASIGRSAIVPDDFDEGNVSQHVAIVRLADKKIRHYLHLCLISPFIQDLIMGVQVGISREGLSMKNLQDFIIPIPPFEEQRRIVARVDQLMSLCDKLEAGLMHSQADSERLMEAVVGGCWQSNGKST